MDDFDTADHRMRAFAQLQSLRETISELQPAYPLRLNFLDDYHRALDQLTASGEDVEEYRIPAALIHRPTGKGGVDTVPRELLLTRVNTVLGYFTLRASV